MPMPVPRKDEARKAFIDRCHSALAGEFKDSDQRHAVCSSQWRKRRGKRRARQKGRSAPKARKV